MDHISRRALLLGTGGLVLSACGSSSSRTGSPNTAASASGKGYELASRFSQGSIVAGVATRVVFSLVNAADGSGVPKGPDSFTGQFSLNGTDIGAPAMFPRRSKDLPGPYWATTTTFDKPGAYVLTATFPDGSHAEQAFTVIDKSANVTPTIGDRAVSVDTPTTAASHGVDPICTKTPACPLHDMSLAQALTSGKPTALLIGTPAYCQTGVCGPVLDVLVAQRAEFAAKMNLIHAEVYTTKYTGASTPTTDAVNAYKLDFEPYLVVIDAGGVIRRRLDVIYDADELHTALAAVS